jgi:hypothetical protein
MTRPDPTPAGTGPGEPPARIWLQWRGEFDSTWCADQTHEDDVEYVRAAPVAADARRTN